MRIVRLTAISCALLLGHLPFGHSAGMTHEQARAYCKELVQNIKGDPGGSRKHGIYVGCVHDKMKAGK
jgi:hypothetical protein